MTRGDVHVQGAAGSGESVPLLQQQQQQQVALQDTYYSSRAEALQNVESTIVELGGIFQQLAHMVGAIKGSSRRSCLMFPNHVLLWHVLTKCNPVYVCRLQRVTCPG